MRSPFDSRDYPADPYPGCRPGVSFVDVDGVAWVVRPAPGTPSGWVVRDSPEVDLDAWLTARGAAELGGRLPVLAYGSNACPGKVCWLREAMGLAGPVVVVEADVEGVAAVWSAGVRARDGQRPAVLAAAPGHTERHAVWLTTPEQRAVLDRTEGRDERYRLAWLRAAVRLANGQRYGWVLAYLARPEAIGPRGAEHLNRSPLLVGGRPVRVADLDHGAALLLTGDPGTDGLEVITAPAEPTWADVDR